MTIFYKLRSCFIVSLGVLCLSAPVAVNAQDEAAQANADSNSNSVYEDALLDPNLYMGMQEAYERNIRLRDPDVKPRDLSTLFFTIWQHRLLQEAKRQSYNTNSNVSQSELTEDASPADRPRGIRELELGGILYHASDNWTVWLNGQRVTPDAIPDQIIDIQVRDDFIELKWYDRYTNLIFPVRLRSHQRFNLDSRIFLPGSSSL